MADTTKTLREAADNALAVLATASSFLSKKARDRAPKVIADLRAALAAQAQPTETSGPDYGPAWLGAAAARVLAQPEVATRHLRNYAALLAAQAQAEPVAHIYAGDCPDENQPHARDPECPACRALIAPQPAAQPVRQPLTERAILDLMPTTIPASMDGELLWFARALERAHHIGKEGAQQ